ncbi:2,3-butanediol dehydrogenase [Comamonas sp.]|uniref:2,3-butanediol dehydrogenase n=1 Tax=Comamonas sp. TaxID=34028 RepID=UPI0012D0D2F3|nr:2,3-butanediol dehydrogenase [Comamonas sp.]MPS94149.1 2,3-butanediol dehydrogenase [Comamonas sp.]
MKALKWHGARDLRLEIIERRPLKAAEIRIEVAYCGICGSDMHEYLHGPDSIPVHVPHPLSGSVAPIVIGHEFCGTVVEVGADVTGLGIGDRVAVEPEYRCGHCIYCRSGRYNLCESMGFVGLMGDGGMAEEAVVPAYMAHVLPPSLDFRQAAVAEPAAVALQGLRTSGLRPGDDCVIFGMGAIGLLLVMMARHHAAGRIIAVDVDVRRLDLARKVGASDTVDASQDDAVLQVRELTDGVGVPVSFEAVGRPETLQGALGVLSKGGEAVLLGLMPEARIDTFDLVNRELRITTSVGYRGLYPELLALMASGVVDAGRIVTHTVSLEAAITDGFELLASAGDAIKVLVAP